MARPNALEAEGIVVSELLKGRWRVELPNGHRMVVWRGRQNSGALLVPGQKVRLQLSPGDFSQGLLLK
jgi:hypothetical protein